MEGFTFFKCVGLEVWRVPSLGCLDFLCKRRGKGWEGRWHFAGGRKFGRFTVWSTGLGWVREWWVVGGGGCRAGSWGRGEEESE